MMGSNQELIEKQYHKRVFYPQWRYIAHVILKCMSCRKKTIDSLNQCLASMMVALNLPDLVQEGNCLALSNMKGKVFANMWSKAGTGVNVKLFQHMLDLDEVPIVEQRDNHELLSSSPQRDDHELCSMPQFELEVP
ncbi:hypothetical protein L1987_45985 [Smallanthus sonchifolius]|uniref:Uncharacterized protein n=1 Tax=Smallanthus sonchifolius TaxID=185202 RepID=A0ACB9FYC6_9ASTR|nr:hypothetical protein L1987_45985 [Smallanthus sonchifolius]